MNQKLIISQTAADLIRNIKTEVRQGNEEVYNLISKE